MEEQIKNSLLIVDDENANIKVLSHILGGDYSIFTAQDGLDAFHKAKEYKPDVILLDILMPEMDGYETLVRLKKDEDTCKIPVIFISGLDSDEDEAKGLSLDAADYITKPFNAAIVRLRVKNQIQIVNQMRIIERLSMIDQLTDIPNRRYFDERLYLEWKVSTREQIPISILMMDLDRFKALNDTYGHQQGDIVLQTVARILPKSFNRPGDFCARWGGEEFVILLPNTPQEGAMDVAERIRKEIEETKILCSNGTTINITISIGAHSAVPDFDSSIGTFVATADKALYAAKQAGRNRVIFLKN
ncbi:MAG: diguanylate cyclase [Treponema sp.]|nr:diguanylate cyclase [Treponema sp.]